MTLQLLRAALNVPKKRSYSITSSARASSDGGTANPRAFAVLRLTISSNFVGCSTGRSAGFAPLRILSTYVAARLYRSEKLGPHVSRIPAPAPVRVRHTVDSP